MNKSGTFDGLTDLKVKINGSTAGIMNLSSNHGYEGKIMLSGLRYNGDEGIPWDHGEQE